jgi:hypothetical protein
VSALVDSGTAATSPEPRRRRWPIALLVGFVNAIAAAVLCVPVADWAMEQLHVSNFEGGRGYAIVCLWIPLSFIVGFVVGFGISFVVKRGGFVGYAIRQGLALFIVAILICGAGGLAYASADHPPLINDQNLALEIEVRVPTKGRSIEELRAADFNIALVVSASDRSYSDLRWSEATRTEEFITLPAWATLNSKNAGREITAGVNGESRQVFNVLRTASPKQIDEAWSEWATPRERFDGSKPAPEDQYLARYRVRFAAEYSPTPTPTATPTGQEGTPEESATPNESETPAESPRPPEP